MNIRRKFGVDYLLRKDSPKQQYRVVWQREGGVQLIKSYATLARAQDRYEMLRADLAAKPLLYCRVEARTIGEWERKLS